MIVPIKEFMHSLSDATPPIILFGPGKAHFNKGDFEPYLVERAIEKLIKKHVDPSLRDLSFTTFHAEDTAPGAVAEEACTPPFLAERRVIVVRNADKYMAMASDKRSPLQPLIDCIENPCDTALLILIAPSVDKRKRLYKACDTSGVIVEAQQLDDTLLGKWIRQEIKKKEFTISNAAVSTLIDRVGSRMSDQINAIELVCNFVAGEREITEAHVRAACGDVAEATVWALTDAIAVSDTSAALIALHELFAYNKSPDDIMGTLNWLLESAYRALPDTSAGPKNNYVNKKVTPLAQKLGRQNCIAALKLCTKTHFALRSTGTDQQLAIEVLVIKLAAPRKAKGVRTRR